MPYLHKFKLPVIAVIGVFGMLFAGHAFAQYLPESTQACTNAIASTQTSCALLAPSQLTTNETLFALLPPYAGVVAAQCAGVTAAGYSTQGAQTAAPPNLADGDTNGNACAFTVTSGAVPTGSAVGTEILSRSPSANGGLIELRLVVCSDGACSTQSVAPFPCQQWPYNQALNPCQAGLNDPLPPPACQNGQGNPLSPPPCQAGQNGPLPPPFQGGQNNPSSPLPCQIGQNGQQGFSCPGAQGGPNTPPFVPNLAPGQSGPNNPQLGFPCPPFQDNQQPSFVC